MTPAYIPLELRRQVRADAGRRCGYCRSSEVLTGMPLEIEHIIPEAAGGLTVRENLWLACHRCNGFKGSRTHAVDPVTGEQVALFNPRTQSWYEHFAWSLDGTLVIGLTPCGRATVEALRLNNEYVVEARRFWVEAGWHPPDE
ncbi:MAG: HNH endonuclease [Chloroflexi bacterium]|nr:MAG: HNH endonuclease [Chloroflexota bacterium]